MMALSSDAEKYNAPPHFGREIDAYASMYSDEIAALRKEVIDAFGQTTIDDLIETAMNRNQVRKGRRPHVEKVIRDVLTLLENSDD